MTPSSVDLPSGASPPLAELPHLERAVARSELLVLAGAGISRLGPSFLPDWFGFNRALLDEAKACALRGLPRLGADAVAALNSLAMDQVAVEAFSDLLVRSFAAEGYFTVLDVLDAERSNANHEALATLARRGLLKTIVTTNFDTLIERAFRDAGVPLTVLTAGDLATPADRAESTTLYKIHGSVSATDTLVDTVSQKLRGLAAPMRERLGELFRTHHVLVVGYSGADLRFGNDYLALSGIECDSPGFTWLVRPGSEPAGEVIALKSRVGSRGAIVTAALPEFFRTLGVQLPDLHVDHDPDAQREAERRAAARIRRFFDEAYVGPLSSVAFCANLLARIGQADAATAVRKALAVEAERWGDRVPKTAAGVFRTIGIGAMAAGDLAGAERWTRMEISFWEAVAAQLPAGMPAEALAELQRNTAAAWMSLSVVQRASERLADAQGSLARALSFAEQAAHPGLQALIYAEAAAIEMQTSDDHDKAIELWRRSISAAVDDGGARQLARSLVGLAEILIRIGEYDLASTEAQRAAGQLPLAVDEDTGRRIEIVRAAIDARRGSPSQALNRLQPQLPEQPADTASGARLRVALARFMGQLGSLRPMALAMLDEVLAAMQAGRLPERGLSGVPERKELEELRAAVAAGGAPAIIALIQVPGRDQEALLRGQIVLAELTRFVSIIALFYERLCHMKRTQGRWLRVMDLAQGLLHSAKRIGDAQRVLEAVNLYNVARAVEGSVTLAIMEFESTLQTAAPGRQRDAIAHNLAILRDETRQPSADMFLTPEVDTPLAQPEARIWTEARSLLDQNDLDGALIVLLRAREAAV